MTSCYRKANSTVITDTSSVDSPCSPITTTNRYSSCCPDLNDGGASLCLSDYLCFWSEIHYTGTTGFIAASCTDETYASGECTEHCTDRPVPDVIYNPDTGLWACCGWDSVTGTDCNNPTDETWPAPPPQSLLAAASIHSSITGTATSSTTSSTSTSSSSSSTITNKTTSPPTSTPSSSSSSSTSSGGLSTGATAGIAIGVVLGVLALALAFYFTWRQGRNSRQRHVGNFEDPRPPQTYQQQDTGKSWGGTEPVKYGDRYSTQPVEMHGRSTGELPTNAPRQQRGSGNLVELQ